MTNDIDKPDCYFAAVAYDNASVATDVFYRPDDREAWIARHVEGRVFEGVHVVSVTRAEGKWQDRPVAAA